MWCSLIFVAFGLVSATQARTHGSAWDDLNGPNHDHMVESAKEENHLHAGGTYEGDIKLAERDLSILQPGENQKRDVHVGKSYKWPMTTIPYEYDSTIDYKTKKAIEQAFAEYKSKSCIRFRQRQSGDQSYIRFKKGNGCYSYVGFVGGKQDISIGSGCEYKSTTTHEILHALGFWHEQSRPDRDQYITIVKSNVYPRMFYNFKKQKSQSFGHPYDYESVMHYHRTAFTNNGRATIIAKKGDRNRNFGQPRNGGLSRIDALQLNAHYCAGSNKTTRKPTTKPRTTPKVNCAPDTKRGCPFWASKGYCTHRFVNYMRRNCPKSCGLSKCNKK